MPFVSKGDRKYYIIFINDFSYHIWVYFIKHPNEVLSIYKTFSVIHFFHADSTGENLSKSLH
jgi:hypothetical protein